MYPNFPHNLSPQVKILDKDGHRVVKKDENGNIEYVRRKGGGGSELGLWVRPVQIHESWSDPAADKKTLGDVLTVQCFAPVNPDELIFSNLDHIQVGGFF